MTSPVNTVGYRISLEGVHGRAEIWGKQIPKPLDIERHAPAYLIPRWVARLTRIDDSGYPMPEIVEAATRDAIMTIVCGRFLPSVGDTRTAMCSWNGLWDTELTREENVRVYGGRYGRAADEPWEISVSTYDRLSPADDIVAAPRRFRERRRLPMKG